jgi:CheY-like chemotaxis protein
MAPSVLLVDGDADSITIYSLILQHHGYEVLAAGDPATGLRLALERRPDVVISDLYLPPLDGRSLHEQLRANEGTASIPMILLDSIAAFGMEEVEEIAITARLTKPCEPSRLLLEVQRMLDMGPVVRRV